MIAVLSQSLPLINILVNAGADVNAADHDGVTVTMHGAAFGLKQTCPILRLLVARGANVNAAANGGWTALMYSVRSNSVGTVKCLLSLGANVNVRDQKGLSALDHVNEIWEISPNDAARKLQRRMRKILIVAGASR
jgi:ankyrin repeat protein